MKGLLVGAIIGFIIGYNMRTARVSSSVTFPRTDEVSPLGVTWNQVYDMMP